MRLCQDAGCPRPHRAPYLSKDIVRDGGSLYGQLTGGLSEVFSWIADQVSIVLSNFGFFPHLPLQVKIRLPEHYQSLVRVFENVPSHQDLLSYPFTNLIVNLGVQTDAHVDPQDDDLCLVIPFGNWMGGELCFYELGIALELCPGDVVMFPSNQITHFNLCMEGYRGSFVLCSDAQMEGWIKDRNGWRRWVK